MNQIVAPDTSELVFRDPFPARRVIPAKLCVVIPMFNEAPRLGETLLTLASSPINRDDVQILFSDDGSADKSAEMALALANNMNFARPIEISLDPVNRGKGAAVRRGVLTAAFAGAELIAFLDADLSLDPAVLDEAISEMKRFNADVVVGERVVDPVRQPKIRRIVSLIFRQLTASVAPTGVRDTQCACKLFTNKAAVALFEPLQTMGFAFDVEVLLRARNADLAVRQIRVQWQHTPGSRVNPLTDAIRMARDVIRIRRIL